MKKFHSFGWIGVFILTLILAGSAAAESLRFSFETAPYKVSQDKEGYETIDMEEFATSAIPGLPMLPYKVFHIAVPPDIEWSSLQITVSGVNLEPLLGVYKIRTCPPDMTWNGIQWLISPGAAEGYQAGVPIRIIATSQLRKWKFVKVEFAPFQYSSKTGELHLIKKADVILSYSRTGERPSPAELQDNVFDDVARDLFLNYSQAREWYINKEAFEAPSATSDYVIITTEAIKANSTKLNEFIAHKWHMGYTVSVITETTWGAVTGQAPNHKAEKIRQWLKANYAARGIKYVLLIGDPHPYESGEGDVPMKMCWPRRGAGSDEDSPCDYFFADLTGNWDKDGDGYYGEWSEDMGSGGVDFTPEVYVGRIPVYSGAYSTLDGILQKIIDYEMDTGSITWRKSILLPMCYSAAGYDGAQLAEQMRNYYLIGYGYTSWRQYQQGSAYATEDSAYSSEEELRGNTVVRDRWAGNDFGIVCWWGHGSSSSASVGYSPNWDGYLFYYTYCSSLDDAHPAFTFQCSCTNAYPEVSYNLAYSILKQGGVETVSATRVSWFNTGVTYGNFDGSTTNSGIGYEYVRRLVVSQSAAGDALYGAKASMTPESNTRLMNYYDFNLYGDPSVSLQKVYLPHKGDLLGTWDGQGVYYRNSKTGSWKKLASPATLIAVGDLGGDKIADLIGVWPTAAGVWFRSSSTGTWTKLASSSARDMATGDMNGDGRDDLLATWDGLGVFYRNSLTGAWPKLASPANRLTAGDLDGDNINDVIGLWPASGGVFVKYSNTGTWTKLASTAPRDMAVGDMNGDGRMDFFGTWDGQGVFYRNSASGAWVKMAAPAELLAAGDLDEDGTDDLIGLWPASGGVFVKYSDAGTWQKLASPAGDISAGLLRGGDWDTGGLNVMELQSPEGGLAVGPEGVREFEDLSGEAPGGWKFNYEEAQNLSPFDFRIGITAPGPGEPGFVWTEQRNLEPREDMQKEPRKERRAKDK
jgi:hypothetical protein